MIVARAGRMSKVPAGKVEIRGFEIPAGQSMMQGSVATKGLWGEASLRARCAMAQNQSTQPTMRTLRFLSSFRTCPAVHVGSALGSVSFSPSSCTLPCWMRRRTSEPDFGSEKIVS